MHFPLPKSLFGFRRNESHHVKYVSMAISRAPRYCSEKPAINKRLALYVAHGDVDFASGWRLHCHSSAYARGKEYILHLYLTLFACCSLGNLDHTYIHVTISISSVKYVTSHKYILWPFIFFIFNVLTIYYIHIYLFITHMHTVCMIKTQQFA